MSPPGGLGSADADGNLRVHEGVVDVGAYEYGWAVFVDGFEGGDLSRWSSAV